MNSKERASLRSEAQTLSPYVMVGHDGITEGVVSALDEALECHELVKVRFQDFKDMIREMSGDLAKATNSELVATTGFTAVFYRKKKEESK